MASKSKSLFLVFILSSFSLLSLSPTNTATSESAASSHAPYKLVNQLCSKQDDKKFCEEVLKSNRRSAFAKNYRTLTIMAVKIATANVTRTQSQFQEMINNKNKQQSGSVKRFKAALSQCIGAYNGVISELKVSLSEFPDYSMAGYDLHIAGDEARRCQSIMDLYGVRDLEIKAKNKITEDFARLCESIMNRVH